jgi:hypothetical protein
MGQYYRPVILNADDEVTAWVRCYDYQNGAKLMEHSYLGNNFVMAVDMLLLENAQRLVWAGDYAEEDYYLRCTEESKKTPLAGARQPPYVINQDKKTYFNRDEVRKDLEGHVLDPLPLLTALGNGRGGRDYRGADTEDVGIWAGDRIRVSFTKPSEEYARDYFFFAM